MISRILGFARDVIIARIFGSSDASDAFFVAFKIPNTLRRLFAEGAFSQAFVPVLTDYKENKSENELRELVSQVAGTFGVVLFGLSLTGVIAAPVIIMLFGPGFLSDPYKYDLAVDMLRFTFPYLFFIAMTAFAGGILNSFGRFAIPALTPVFLNIVFIIMAVFVSPHLDEPIMALAWAVFIAGIVQLLFQVPFLLKLKLLPKPKWGWKHPGVQKIKNLMIPAILGSSVVQINLMFDTLLASFLVTGSISWLYYSDRLVEFPLGLLGIAIATVILPKLSQDQAKASADTFSATLDWALRCAILIGLPAAVGLIVLAAPMLATLFYGGAFTPEDVFLSSLSLTAYSLGLMGFILIKVLAPGFYARQDTATPVKIGIKAMIANMVLNVIFVVPLYMMDYKGAHTGLALATAVSAYINAWMLLHTLRKGGHYQPQRGWLRLIMQSGFACITMATALYWLSPPIEVWLDWSVWTRIGNLLLFILAGGSAYFIALFLSGVKLKPLLRTG